MENNRPAKSRIRVRWGEGPPPTVDGHPGWVRQSVRQYAAMCVLVIGAQGFLVGVGPVLNGARSAAWWCLALGLPVCGLLLWLPVFGMMHGKGKPVVTMPEAFTEAYGAIGGGIISSFFALQAVFDTIVAARAAGGLVRQYLVVNANEIAVTLSAIAAIALVIFRHGGRGLSRFLWISKKLILVTLLACCAVMIRNASTDNLFPLIGNSAEDTAYAFVYAASGCSGILMLGLLPQQIGSAKRVRFRTGLRALLLGTLAAVLLMLVVNLCTPPRSVVGDMVWGHQALLPAEYISQRALRLAYISVLAMVLVLAAGASLSAGSMFLQGAFTGRKGKWCVVVLALLAAGIALPTDQAFTRAITALMPYRVPVAMAPAWITWGVLMIRRRMKKGGGTA